MTWKKLDPAPRSGRAPRVKARVLKDKFGGLRIHLQLNAACGFVAETKVQVYEGENDNAGAMRMATDPDGPFVLKKLGSGGVQLLVPAVAGAPDRNTISVPCAIRSRTGADLVVSMPVSEWEAGPTPPSSGRLDLQRSASPPRSPPVAPPPPPAPPASPPPSPVIGRVDMVDYLTNKGVKISRNIGGKTFNYDGEVRTFEQVHAMVNQRRLAADLPLLEPAQVY